MVIKKISRKEVEDLIKSHFKIKEINYFINHETEGYGKDPCTDWAFIEGEELNN